MNTPDSGDKYYLQYGFIKDPFPVDMVEGNIFLTAEINRRLKYIKSHIADKDRLLIVSGARGAGKSLLAQKAVVLKEADWCIAEISVKEKTTIESWSLTVLQQLRPDLEIDPAQALVMLHKYLEESYKNNTRPVILVDDAEKLSFDVLQFILQLAGLRYNETFFSIVLFANEFINEKLSKAGLKELAENMLDTIYLPGLTRNQVRDYLNYRFSANGKDIEFPFSDTDIEFLWNASGGLPGGINLLARKLMQEALHKDEKSQDFKVALSVLVSVALMALVYLYYQNTGLKAELLAHEKKIMSLSTATKPADESPGQGRRAQSSTGDSAKFTGAQLTIDSLSLKLSELPQTGNSIRQSDEIKKPALLPLRPDND